MNDTPKLLDVVALAEGLPDEQLVRGQVGTIVEMLGQDHAEVEFSDDRGKTYAMLPVALDQLIVLHHSPVATH
ncbi:MAG TPA: DUF4926 domain-containing protein [Lacipirellulaceae bacterium]|nr:DUF4926 domain-containing protein [Lacipirellulaceae bacterium]